MTVIGLDLSLTGTGFCCLGGEPVLHTIKSTGTTKDTVTQRDDRLQSLTDRILRTANCYPTADLVVIEGPAFSRQGGANWDRAGLWWRIIHHLHDHGHQVAVVGPTVLKKWATGKGTADKVAVAVHLSRLWPEVNASNDNEWDALALATMGAQWLGRPAPSRAHHAAALAGAEWPAKLAVAS